MADEFTVKMHQELLGDELENWEFRVLATYGDINRGTPKEEALKKHGITLEFYEKNLHKALYPKSK